MNAQIKWLIGAVVALVVINIALVAFVWLRKDGNAQQRGGDAREYLIKTLSLNEQQQKTFDSLRDGHFEKMKGYNEQMHHLKDALFEQLKSAGNPSADSIAQKIGQMQTKIDLETFNHFSQLRAILTKEQAEKFDNTIQDVLRTMGPPGRNGPPPGNRPDGDRPPLNGDRPPPDGDRPPPPGN